MTELTHSVNPIKLREYAAAGLPDRLVAASGSSQMRRHRDVRVDVRRMGGRACVPPSSSHGTRAARQAQSRACRARGLGVSMRGDRAAGRCDCRPAFGGGAAKNGNLTPHAYPPHRGCAPELSKARARPPCCVRTPGGNRPSCTPASTTTRALSDQFFQELVDPASRREPRGRLGHPRRADRARSWSGSSRFSMRDGPTGCLCTAT